MSESEFVQNTRRKLPHIQLPDSVLFITWRLAFTLPQQSKAEKSEDKTYLDTFMHYDNLLDKSDSAKINLVREPYLSIIKNALHFYSDKKYEIYAFCVMQNHVHLVVKPALKNSDKFYTLEEITFAIKSYTAHAINKLDNSKDKVWQTESYDHVVRDETELISILNYVINNPVKSSLAEKWEDWEGTYISKKFV